MKRSGKFYSNNEKKTLKFLGLIPAPMSGAGWVIKEDGENETLMVQLKSTDSSSYRIDMLDIKKLEYHASVSNKVPVFLVQFLKQDKIYAIVDINDIGELYNGLENKENVIHKKTIVIDNKENTIERKVVKSNKKARDKFFEERSKSIVRRK